MITSQIELDIYINFTIMQIKNNEVKNERG